MSSEIQTVGSVHKKSLLQRFKLFFILVVVGFLISSCTEVGIIPPKVMHDFARDYPAWTEPKVQNVDTRDLKEGELIEGDTTYDCSVETKELSPSMTSYKDIMLAGLDADVLYPGSLLQGDDIEKGLLRSVRLDRAPITMTISLQIDNPSITVDNPTTATMRNAVSELIRRADTRLGAIDVVPGNILFNKIEAHSYEQSLNQVGISAGYDDKISTKVDASFNFGSERKASSHTIMVYLVEPLFKLNFSEDTVRSPDDLLANTVTAEDIEQETAAGRMGPNNLPVYVKTVTYGRIMMYTLTSEEVEDFQRLEAAVSGSYGNFSGGADYTDEDKSIIRNSRETLIAFGGSQQASKDAILDLKKFFVPVEATQAVPISYEIRDVKGNVASIGDITEYKVQNCVAQAKDTQTKIEVTYTRITATEKCDGILNEVNEYRGTLSALGKSRTYNKDLETNKSADIGITLSNTYTNLSPSAGFNVSARYVEADVGGSDNLGTSSKRHSVKSGPFSGSLNLSGDGCSMRLDYSIKVTNL